MDWLNYLIGIEVEKLTFVQMLVRSLIVFFSALAFIRVGGQRTLGTQNAFDQLTLLILGAVLGRAIVSAQQPFFPSLGAVLLIVMAHRWLAWLTFKSRAMGKIFKGKDALLVEDGRLYREAMKDSSVTEEDIQEAMRLIGNINDLSEVKEARLERAGEISIVRK